MAKFPLDLSKFHKLSSDKDITTLEHADGHQIRLLHKALEPSTREKLAALPMKAEKGAAKAIKEASPTTDAATEEPTAKLAEGGPIKPKEAPDSPPIGTQNWIRAFLISFECLHSLWARSSLIA